MDDGSERWAQKDVDLDVPQERWGMTCDGCGRRVMIFRGNEQHQEPIDATYARGRLHAQGWTATLNEWEGYTIKCPECNGVEPAPNWNIEQHKDWRPKL